MAKFEGKSFRGTGSAKQKKEAVADRRKLTAYVRSLLELHKLQGTLLDRLKKEV